MKDCSNCKKKPKAGEEYIKTPCRRCLPYEPSTSERSIFLQKPDWWWDNFDQRKAQGLDTVARY